MEEHLQSRRALLHGDFQCANSNAHLEKQVLCHFEPFSLFYG